MLETYFEFARQQTCMYFFFLTSKFALSYYKLFYTFGIFLECYTFLGLWDFTIVAKNQFDTTIL